MKKIFLFLFLPILLFSKVIIQAPSTFFEGESVVFNINVSGANIEFPKIESIDGYGVQSLGTSSQTTIINYVTNRNVTRKYRFFPKKDVIIPSFKIIINGKVEKTKKKHIKLLKVKQTKSSLFNLKMSVNKTNVYVGEDIVLTLVFKYKKNIQLYDLKFGDMNFDNFWSKQLTSDKPQDDGQYITQKLKFLIFPQKSGKLNISAVKIIALLADVGMFNNFFGSSTKSVNIYSNTLDINAKALPKDINLIGDFKIDATVDKTSIHQGQAVSYKLKIMGRGNIDDLDEIKLDILNTTIYDNHSIKNFDIKDNKYGGTYKKTYSIVSQNDFIIPSIKLQFFDKKTDTIKTITTKEYKIRVLDSSKIKQTLQVQSKYEKPKTKEIIMTKTKYISDDEKILFFLLGFISSFLLIVVYLIYKKRFIKKESTTVEINIKNSKTIDDLFKNLVPYINIGKNLDNIIYSLETKNNIDLKKIKKDILKIIKELKI
jgi:hypothetical protein